MPLRLQTPVVPHEYVCRAARLLCAAGARVVSLAPGVIDTDMQVQLRSGDPEAFPDRERFVQLKAMDQLATADEAAARVLTYLGRADFGAHPVADVRDA